MTGSAEAGEVPYARVVAEFLGQSMHISRISAGGCNITQERYSHGLSESESSHEGVGDR